MSEAWYAEGLRFSCQRSGRCCTGASGNIWVSHQEIEALAQRLGVDIETFCRKYTRTVHRKGQDRMSIIDIKTSHNNYDCVFFKKGQGCTVYEERPTQCRTWPFWECNLGDQEAWEALQSECPGVGKGHLYSAREIGIIKGDDGLPK